MLLHPLHDNGGSRSLPCGTNHLVSQRRVRCCSVFDHWEQMTYDPLKPDSPSNVIMLDTRKRKGLKPEPNTITEYEVISHLIVYQPISLHVIEHEAVAVVQLHLRGTK